uniref:Uncharacterized protein n=1 Tax=Anopheles quadriannulatus TaxID=34691 RepID=A0A182XS51_ANOQN
MVMIPLDSSFGISCCPVINNFRPGLGSPYHPQNGRIGANDVSFTTAILL